jgi:hypothetical protein
MTKKIVKRLLEMPPGLIESRFFLTMGSSRIQTMFVSVMWLHS